MKIKNPYTNKKQLCLINLDGESEVIGKFEDGETVIVNVNPLIHDYFDEVEDVYDFELIEDLKKALKTQNISIFRAKLRGIPTYYVECYSSVSSAEVSNYQVQIVNISSAFLILRKRYLTEILKIIRGVEKKRKRYS